ncbi:HNH endonuclease [Yersinia phage fPS-53]|uniref:Homing endonuclease n=3 Tax=Helsettvirus TaxID=2732684 RepID=A0A2H1UKS2_9CAUD|nr:HNH endonuclease [Yersinia phage fPS-53]YP_009799193.1 HNH endonuclease [Yersinia phage fPS-54-ocr]SOO46600.1 homing endonuclease [Yersinia phage fPS-89]SOO56482.1 homing endonuclease [Yersinia phage fPS-53]SOP75983.1 HNH homing endonuclease [Yersinia phage fPS-54-ocr]
MRKSYKQFYKQPRNHIQVWVSANGPIPSGYYIDHIDGNPLNDNLDNLRLATPSENSRNMKTPSSNITGLKWLSWCPLRLTWRGTLKVNYKQHSYRSKDLFDVVSWLFRTRREIHGQFARNR